MNALEFNNKIANLITKFITNIPTIGQLKIYQHPRMGDTLTYHQSDFNYYITYSQYLD